MTILKYFDLKRAAISALNDYPSMKAIIANTDEEIRQKYHEMTGVKSPVYTAAPRIKGFKSASEKMGDALSDIDVLKLRYREAVNYMNWFQPAWDALCNRDRFILETFYLNEDTKGNAVYVVMGEYSIERSTAYRWKDIAVEHLSTLLYGGVHS